MIANKYNLIEKINEGSFGTVFKAVNKRTDEYVAIKFEDKNSIIKSLKNEAKIYQYLGKLDGFPYLKMFGTINDKNFLVMNLLGHSLTEIIQTNHLNINNVLYLGIQIIKRIQTLHEHHLLHRDIKPSNFIFGKDNETNKLYLVDFGFAKRYNYYGTHIEEKSINKIVGSPNFVSLNVHNLIEPSRRDDIESCIYIILTMLLGKLEWFHKSNIIEIANLKKEIISNDEIPSFIKNMLYYIRQLDFNEKPDYEYLIKLMMTELDKYNI
jgi:serine/threonine protein kinase